MEIPENVQALLASLRVIHPDGMPSTFYAEKLRELYGTMVDYIDVGPWIVEASQAKQAALYRLSKQHDGAKFAEAMARVLPQERERAAYEYMLRHRSIETNPEMRWE
jgi:UDP-N-acetyl-D-mannosaminuronic acid transferase (WecB/TagA/CpsF family)